MDKEPRGKFNLDYEESVLFRSRIGVLMKALTAIYTIAIYLLKFGRMSETERDKIREIRDLSGKKDNW